MHVLKFVMVVLWDSVVHVSAAAFTVTVTRATLPAVAYESPQSACSVWAWDVRKLHGTETFLI